MNKYINKKSLIIAAAFIFSTAHAGVNVNNGNFFVAYRDLFIPTQGINIEVTRTYNSRSSYIKGYFGVGWSSELEGYIKVEPQFITYFEGGGANVLKFEPNTGSTKASKKSVALKSWVNKSSGIQTFTEVSKGVYKLQSNSGKNIWFDSTGRLTKISDNNKNSLEFIYSAGQLTSLKDNFNNQVKFTWKTFGNSPRIVRIERNETKAVYVYQPNGNLEQATGGDGIPYTYTYDDEFNMMGIAYKDGKSRVMSYNKSKDWVLSFKDVDGVTTNYDYYSDSLDPENKFGTTVTRLAPNSKDKDISMFWYEFRKRADGSRFNYKTSSFFLGNVTENLFTECCGTPLVISQWSAPEFTQKAPKDQSWTVAKSTKKSTLFEYNTDGMLKKKTSPDGTIAEINYDDSTRKISSVERAGRKLKYQYDSRSNLATVFDSIDTKQMDLTYDLNGRITVLKEKSIIEKTPQMRTVFFRYDSKGRPVEIKEKMESGKKGEQLIRMVYDSEGNMREVLNAKSRTIASLEEIQVAQRIVETFQGLLDVVQPAGISLNPEI